MQEEFTSEALSAVTVMSDCGGCPVSTMGIAHGALLDVSVISRLEKKDMGTMRSTAITSRPVSRVRRSSQTGYVLAVFGVMAIGLVASVGLAIDFGTAFVVRNEAQTFVDSAVLAATIELDGTGQGLDRARQRALSMPNQWMFGSSQFEGVLVEFASAAQGPWSNAPASGAGVLYARVTVTADAPMVFLPLVTNEQVAKVRASAVGGQLEKTTFDNGIFPFSPFAHDDSDPTGNFGFEVGTQYTLRWPNNMNKHAKPCSGDVGVKHVLDMKEEAGQNIQGYIDSNSASDIRDAITKSEQTGGRVYSIGSPIFMANGNKQSMERAMQDRVLQDTDTVSKTYTQYSQNGGVGNGRRLVIVPVNEGPASNFRNSGYGLFFLNTADTYQISPSESFCGEYVGPALLGAPHPGANTGGGAYAVRLVR